MQLTSHEETKHTEGPAMQPWTHNDEVHCAAKSSGQQPPLPPVHHPGHNTHLGVPVPLEAMVNGCSSRHALEPMRLDLFAGQGWQGLPSGEKKFAGQGVPRGSLEPGMHDRPGVGLQAPTQPALVRPGASP
jgi:hypothetical protein